MSSADTPESSKLYCGTPWVYSSTQHLDHTSSDDSDVIYLTNGDESTGPEGESEPDFDEILDELNCSDLDVPLFTTEIIAQDVQAHLLAITNEQWKSFLEGRYEAELVELLSHMCLDILEKISILVLKTVEPQILARVSGLLPSNSINTLITRNYRHVTAEDIQASFGTSLDRCFGEVFGVKQHQSPDSDRLLELFSEDVQKRVNYKLSKFRGLGYFPPSGQDVGETDTVAMVSHVINILKELIAEQTLSSEQEETVDSDCSGSWCSDMVSYDEEEEDAYTSELSESTITSLPQEEKTLLIVCVVNLVQHVAVSTRTSILDVDLDGILTRVKEKSLGELSSTTSPILKKLHIIIYNKLCQEFGCAKLLQAAMVSGDETFEESFVKILKSQLLESRKEDISFMKQLRRFFSKRTAKVSPACEVSNTSALHSEVSDQENEPNNQIRHIKFFTSVRKILRKTFTCSTGCGSQDSYNNLSFLKR